MNRRARAKQFTQNIIIRRMKTEEQKKKKKRSTEKRVSISRPCTSSKVEATAPMKNLRARSCTHALQTCSMLNAHVATLSFQFRLFVFRKYAFSNEKSPPLLCIRVNLDFVQMTRRHIRRWHDTIYGCTIGPAKKKHNCSSFADVRNFWMQKKTTKFIFEFNLVIS